MSAGAPLTVWDTGQQPARIQRASRYLPAATTHPAKMLPAIAAQAIRSFTRPGDLVADPMCGIGTTLIEAIHLGRDAVGIEYEPRWAHLAVAGIKHARAHDAVGSAEVIRGDARDLTALVPGELHGTVTLVLTSPPYGDSTHGVASTTSGGVSKKNHRYSRDRANLGNRASVSEQMTAFALILAGCRTLLRPGGLLAVTVRPVRRHGVLTDLPGLVIAAAHDAGFRPAGRYAALICGLRGDGLVTRASFFAQHETRRMRAAGLPACVIAHEDLLLFSAAEPA
jgi:modification methylase